MSEVANKADPKNWLGLYGDLMYQFCLPRVNDNIVAEDLVQETFLSALKGLEGYKGEASEKNWLFAILKNKIIDYYRKKSKAVVVTVSEAQDTGDDWFNDEGRWAENRRPQDWAAAENPTERKELQKIINACKDKLKDLQQEVFILKYLEDIDSDEICKVLNITSSNYWILLHRARLQMRGCVENNWLKN